MECIRGKKQTQADQIIDRINAELRLENDSCGLKQNALLDKVINIIKEVAKLAQIAKILNLRTAQSSAEYAEHLYRQNAKAVCLPSFARKYSNPDA